jgi:hypothetical protein
LEFIQKVTIIHGPAKLFRPKRAQQTKVLKMRKFSLYVCVYVCRFLVFASLVHSSLTPPLESGHPISDQPPKFEDEAEKLANVQPFSISKMVILTRTTAHCSIRKSFQKFKNKHTLSILEVSWSIFFRKKIRVTFWINPSFQSIIN